MTKKLFLLTIVAAVLAGGLARPADGQARCSGIEAYESYQMINRWSHGDSRWGYFVGTSDDTLELVGSVAKNAMTVQLQPNPSNKGQYFLVVDSGPDKGMGVGFTGHTLELSPADDQDDWMPVEFQLYPGAACIYWMINRWRGSGDSIDDRWGEYVGFDDTTLKLYGKDSLGDWMPVQMQEVLD